MLLDGSFCCPEYLGLFSQLAYKINVSGSCFPSIQESPKFEVYLITFLISLVHSF